MNMQLQDVCGIDFGTSNTAISVFNHGSIELVPLEGGEGTMPSAMFFPFDGEKVSYGRLAISEYTNQFEGRLIRSLKSALGTDIANDKTQILNDEFSYEELIARYLGEVKSRAEMATGRHLTRAVIGRPVNFNDERKEKNDEAEEILRKAALRIGFTDVAFLFEPFAAWESSKLNSFSGKTVLVFDSGGGTTDISVIRVGNDSGESVLANDGIKWAGTNIDHELNLRKVMPELGYGQVVRGQHLPHWIHYRLASWQTIFELYQRDNRIIINEILEPAKETTSMKRLATVVNSKYGYRVVGDVEAAKIRLAKKHSTKLKLNYVESDLEIECTREDLEHSINSGIIKLDSVLNSVLETAGLSTGKIDVVLLTGGTTLSPAIRYFLSEKFSAAKAETSDTFGAVAKGLGLKAGELFAQ